MSPSVRLDDVIEALESPGDEHVYYLDKRTGEIVLVTDEDMSAAEEDELISAYPDWQRDSILKAREVLRDSEQFIQLPDRFDIHEYKIMEDFCLAFKDRQVGGKLLRLIKGSGAFGRFKNAIHELRVEKAWHEFKRSELEKIAIDWLEENEIPYSRDETIDVSDVSM
ncbi:MAG TPA: UPF0158 family protein [Pyrinomonadaceae bacterium]|nr:UPF0158 family protein [Pyrinomonadaceae bacterium]